MNIRPYNVAMREFCTMTLLTLVTVFGMMAMFIAFV